MITTGIETVKQPLQKSGLRKKGLCDYVVNVASGCLHKCLFCYVPSTPAIRTRVDALQRNGVKDPQKWGSYLLVREDIPEQLRNSLPRKRTWEITESGKGVVLLCSGTDPYQNCKTAAVTRRVVTELLAHNKRVRILTRSPLWTKDLDILVHPNVTVGMSIPYMDDELSRKMEPGAPRPSDRVRAMQTGLKAGCRLFVAMAPTNPDMSFLAMKEHVERLLDLNPEVIFWEPINLRGENGSRMIQAGIDFAGDVQSKQRWVSNFRQQWSFIRSISNTFEMGDRLHIWPDKALQGSVDQTELDYWFYRPTVEKWKGI